MIRSSHPPESQPTEIAEKLQRLKQALQEETQLARISDVFWEELAQKPWFSGAGHPAENPGLRFITERACRHVLGGEHRVTSTMLIHLPEHGFWHGCCVLDGRLGQVFYFDDIDRGLLTIAGDIGSDTTHFVRFSMVTIELGRARDHGPEA